MPYQEYWRAPGGRNGTELYKIAGALKEYLFRVRMPPPLFNQRNRESGLLTWIERNPDVRDFYDDNEQFTVTNVERNRYNSFLEGLEREVLDRAVKEDQNYYILEFANEGGLVMPIILEVAYENGNKEEIRLPAQIWRRSPAQVKKLLVTQHKIANILVDPLQETADTNIENNYYPRRTIPSRIESYKSESSSGLLNRDIMHDSTTEIDSDDNGTEESDEN